MAVIPSATLSWCRQQTCECTLSSYEFVSFHLITNSEGMKPSPWTFHSASAFLLELVGDHATHGGHLPSRMNRGPNGEERWKSASLKVSSLPAKRLNKGFVVRNWRQQRLNLSKVYWIMYSKNLLTLVNKRTSSTNLWLTKSLPWSRCFAEGGCSNASLPTKERVGVPAGKSSTAWK